MNGGLAWLLFTGLYVLAALRWARDARRYLEPWLRRKLARVLGLDIDLLPASRSHPTDREWRGRKSTGHHSATASWLSVVVAAFVVFAPAAPLFFAARFQLIPWRWAGMLLGLSLMISCTAWLVPSEEERAR
jgi:hypothetical protein